MRSYQSTDTDIATALDALDAMPDVVQRESRRGAKTTKVYFRGPCEIHKTAREAFVALLNQLIAYNPAPLNSPRVTGGRKGVRNILARRQEDLFLRSPHLLDSRSNWREVKWGWYVITNMNTTEMFKTLCRFANTCGLELGKDWDFEPLAATEEMNDRRLREKLNQEMVEKALEELDTL